jgi:hypothetical protein
MTSKINRCHYRDGKQVCIKIATFDPESGVIGKFCVDHVPWTPKEVSTITHEQIDIECRICQEKDSKKMHKLTCGHEFHVECLKQMFNTKCPLCRAPMINLTPSISSAIDKNIPPEDVISEEFMTAIQHLGDYVVANQYLANIGLSCPIMPSVGDPANRRDEIIVNSIKNFIENGYQIEEDDDANAIDIESILSLIPSSSSV